ncbi:hypothetical protein KAJ38_00820 [Candidatus Pacearchaeota archaeon]|nr:hypothetical protein [Candidatus Pacearchaeota archaeon]
MGWKNFPEWLKGGITGFVVTVVPYTICYITPINQVSIWIIGPLQILMLLTMAPVIILFQLDVFYGPETNNILAMLGSVIFWTLIGMLSGFVVGNMNERKLEKLHSNNSEGIR